jgi:hypothetical protein
MDNETYDQLVIALSNDLPISDDLTAAMETLSSEGLLQLLSDVTNLPMQAWKDALARQALKDSREHIAALEAERARLRAACGAALAIHDRYCDRVGASESWARSAHDKLRAALAGGAGVEQETT